MDMKLQKKHCYMVAVISACVLAAMGMFISRSSGDAIVAWVNGEEVAIGEYKRSLQKNRALVYSYFKNKHGVDDSGSFWDTVYEGESPLEKIKEDALLDCVNIKVVQVLAREKGLIQDISYKNFLKEFKAENMRRKDALSKNQVIYGPQQYGESGYFEIRFTDLLEKLKSASGIAVSDDEIKAYYDSNIHMFMGVPTIRIMKIAVKYPGGGKSGAEEKIMRIREKLDMEAAFEDISAAYAEDESIEVNEQEFSPETARADHMIWRELVVEANRLEAGETSRIIDTDGAFFIIKCVEKTLLEPQPFNEKKENIRSVLEEKKFKEYIDGQINTADVQINPKLYPEIGKSYAREIFE